MSDPTYDLIVIGTGAGGSAAATKCRKAGWTVAVVDRHPFGGTCALRGCDPKKVLVGGAHLADWARRMKGRGITGDTGIDWPALMAFKRSFTEPVPGEREAGFEKRGIDTFHGRARFIDEQTVSVETSSGTRYLGANYVLLANGAKPAPLPFDGAELLATSTDFLELETLPNRIAFIGSGYISMEFAHIAARAGAEVVMIDMLPRPLPLFDEQMVEHLAEHTRVLGISLVLDTKVTGVKRRGDGYAVYAESKNEEAAVFEADLVVHGAGRVPELDEMDLEAGGVARGSGGVTVNGYLQSTTNERVYAAGDAADTEGPPLTPVASMESHVAASNLLKGNHRTPDHRGIPTVVFTIPPLASVGLTEAEAREQGMNVTVNYNPDITGWYSHRRLRADSGAFKVLIDEGTGRIAGAHVLGANAGEFINLFALAIRHGLSAADLRHGTYAYPTHASDLPYMI